jgi:hypothetical protein
MVGQKFKNNITGRSQQPAYRCLKGQILVFKALKTTGIMFIIQLAQPGSIVEYCQKPFFVTDIPTPSKTSSKRL